MAVNGGACRRAASFFHVHPSALLCGVVGVRVFGGVRLSCSLLNGTN